MPSGPGPCMERSGHTSLRAAQSIGWMVVASCLEVADHEMAVISGNPVQAVRDAQTSAPGEAWLASTVLHRSREVRELPHNG